MGEARRGWGSRTAAWHLRLLDGVGDLVIYLLHVGGEVLLLQLLHLNGPDVVVHLCAWLAAARWLGARRAGRRLRRRHAAYDRLGSARCAASLPMRRRGRAKLPTRTWLLRSPSAFCHAVRMVEERPTVLCRAFSSKEEKLLSVLAILSCA